MKIANLRVFIVFIDQVLITLSDFVDLKENTCLFVDCYVHTTVGVQQLIQLFH